jgi:hypothetical protein
VLKKLENYIIPLFLVAWTILNLFQAGYSELLHDEAYYWMYSRWLSFGYFDHPPMIAVFIKLGYGLFNSELGVRFVTVITTSITLGIVWYLCKWYFAKPWLYILICLSISFLHFLGFLAIPDSPLFFFTAVFLVAYRSYLWKTSLFNTLLLAAAMAAMMYSKYHGALIIIFTIASNPKLLTRWSFWLAGVIALILFAPHMIWQVENEYPSIMYHLIDRSNRPYSILNTLSFIGGQLLIFGPICGIILMYSAIKQKTESEFGRTLKFILIGTFIFFFLASFKGWVEGNWTAPLLIPMIILGYKSLGTNENLRKWFLRFAIPMIILIIPARVYFVYDFLPEKYSLRTDIHNWKKWSEELKKEAGEHPVVLQNSYQKASKYAFYSGGSMVHSSNNHWYRKNQFDIWNFEEQFQGDSVLFIANTEVGSWDSLKTEMETLSFLWIDNFVGFSKLESKIISEDISCKINDTLKFTLEVYSPYPYEINLEEFKPVCKDMQVLQVWHQNGVPIYTKSISPFYYSIPSMSHIEIEIEVTAPEVPGNYRLAAPLKVGHPAHGLNCNYISVTVSE